MKVILLEDVVGVGNAGDVAQVKKGFARNYLLPKGIVIEANAANMKTLEHRRAKIAAKKAADKEAAELFAKQIDGKVLNFVAKAGEGGKLFGSVTTADIAEEILAKLGFEVDRRKIDIEGSIKEIGEHAVSIKIYPEVAAIIKVVVEPEGGILEKSSIEDEAEQSADTDEDMVIDTAVDETADAPAETAETPVEAAEEDAVDLADDAEQSIEAVEQALAEGEADAQAAQSVEEQKAEEVEGPYLPPEPKDE
jgi:large subunit ribosomal protein L9